MARQGCVLSENEIKKIVSLLASTDMAIGDIAERLGCSRSAVLAINRKFQVRDYAGNRSSWLVEVDSADPNQSRKTLVSQN